MKKMKRDKKDGRKSEGYRKRSCSLWCFPFGQIRGADAGISKVPIASMLP
jgi:hypothetical protein